jgi:hypothetical protein
MAQTIGSISAADQDRGGVRGLESKVLVPRRHLQDVKGGQSEAKGQLQDQKTVL